MEKKYPGWYGHIMGYKTGTPPWEKQAREQREIDKALQREDNIRRWGSNYQSVLWRRFGEGSAPRERRSRRRK